MTDGKTELVKAQKAFFEKVIDITSDLDNVYFDLVHETVLANRE